MTAQKIPKRCPADASLLGNPVDHVGRSFPNSPLTSPSAAVPGERLSGTPTSAFVALRATVGSD
jgi:hypothetical protein